MTDNTYTFNGKDRDGLNEILKNNIVQVEFEKTDGSIRHMRATLQQSYLPKSENVNESKPTREPNPAICNVWDVDADGWRAFRIGSIIMFVPED